MINLQTVRVLVKQGFEMPAIMEAVKTAEATGSAELGGWVVRTGADGKMFAVHPSYCGIYVGDYSSHLIFQKNLSYSFGRFGFMSAKYRDLPTVLARLDEHKTNGFILCECCACQYERRKKQVEKEGFTVRRTNISACTSDTSTCFFLIA